jgi:hypothetical protein
MPTDASSGLIALYVTAAALAILLMGLNPRWIPAMLVIVMPTGNFDLEGPVTLTLSKIVLLVFVITLPAQIAVAARQVRRIRVPLSLCLFFLVVVITTVGSLAWSGNLSSEGFDALRDPVFRPIVQIGSLGFRASAFVAIQMWASEDISWAKVCKATLFASTLVAAYGVYQIIGYYSDWPIMTIHRAQTDLSGGYAFFTIGSLTIFRVGSFVGEPKVAAEFLLPSVILIMFARSTGVVRLRSWLTSIPILVLHVVVFILTFATSSFFGLLVSLPILSYLLWGLPGRLRLDRLFVATMFLCLAVAGLVALGGGREIAGDVLRARTTDRIVVMDTPERATIDFFLEHPRALFTGIGWGNASFYLRPYFDPDYYLPLTVSLNSGYFQVLLEGGLLALSGFLWFLGGSLLRALRIAAIEKGSERGGMITITLAVCVVLAATNAFYGAETQIWIFWGLLLNLCAAETRTDPVPANITRTLVNPRLSREAAHPLGVEV